MLSFFYMEQLFFQFFPVMKIGWTSSVSSVMIKCLGYKFWVRSAFLFRKTVEYGRNGSWYLSGSIKIIIVTYDLYKTICKTYPWHVRRELCQVKCSIPLWVFTSGVVWTLGVEERTIPHGSVDESCIDLKLTPATTRSIENRLLHNKKEKREHFSELFATS